MIEVMTKNNEIRLRKEDYEDYKVVGPNGVEAPFWTALTEVLGVEPWTGVLIVNEDGLISIGDLDK